MHSLIAKLVNATKPSSSAFVTTTRRVRVRNAARKGLPRLQ